MSERSERATATIIRLPIEPPEPPQPIDDMARWVNVLFVCSGLYNEDARKLLLVSLLLNSFADVPDTMPSRDEILRHLDDPSLPGREAVTAALARYAVKRMLKALTAEGEEQRRAIAAADATFAAFVASIGPQP